MPLTDNTAARANVLARVRQSLRRSAETPGQRTSRQTQALAYLSLHQRGPTPPLPAPGADLVVRFQTKAEALASTVEWVDELGAVPAAVARYRASLGPSSAPEAASGLHVWPTLQNLPWSAVGLSPTANVHQADLGVTTVLCAIAETGTLMLVTAPDQPLSTALLPATHVAVVRVDQVVPTMEDAFACLRTWQASFQHSPQRLMPHPMPRGVHFISGPSRTADIDQTLVMGAHGPYRVHIALVRRFSGGLEATSGHHGWDATNGTRT